MELTEEVNKWKFTTDEITFCINVGKLSHDVKVQAGILKALLLGREVFFESTTRAEVLENKEFMELFLNYMKLGFSDDKTTSHIADFTLLQIPPRDIVQHCPNILAEGNATLTRNRRNALLVLGKARDSMVMPMNFKVPPIAPFPVKKGRRYKK